MESTAVQDLKGLDPVPHRKTLVLLNNFIVNTTRFLNSFLVVCDDKLCSVSQQVSRLETSLSILEAKLTSVPELEAATAASDMSAVPEVSSAPAAPAPAATAPAAAPAQAQAQAPPPPPAQAGPTVKEDPTYARYFKLMRLGMPLEQVKLKCQAEGNDPSVLDNPDAPLSSLGGDAGGGGVAAPAAAAAATSTAVVAVADGGGAGNADGALETALVPAGDAAEDAAADVMLVKDDPAFKKFFKMVGFGIPPPAVKTKMQMEGLDPSLLDTPNAPSPNA